jgi:hypothetical protein
MTSQTALVTHIDVRRLEQALLAGIAHVLSRRDHLNRINVFPVADSDTGTNLAFTLASVRKVLQPVARRTLPELLEQIAAGFRLAFERAQLRAVAHLFPRLDVRVVGIAGGSLGRVGKRMGRVRLLDVGPRSAHIAGLPYACFEPTQELEGAKACLIAPRPGDPPEYLVLENQRGRRIAVTLTCAANALDAVANH